MAAVFTVAAAWSGTAAAQDRALTIGVSQIAAALHPSIETAVAKPIVLDKARRPLDPYLVVRQVEWGTIDRIAASHGNSRLD